MTGATTDAPIGVFDSGVGGLTVVGEIRRQLPCESVVYVGDTARLPYGPKSPETVRRYAREIAGFLVGERVKALVIACNTATAHALDVLREELPLPVIGVVRPGARAAVAVSRGGPIGVVGTAGTIRSGAYERAIREMRPGAVVVSRPCPLFVPLVEEGWVDHEATRIVAGEYLRPLLDAGVDTLVLGCTHYPLLAPLIRSVVGPGVTLIDSARETAAEVASVLRSSGLQRAPGSSAAHRFLATDDPERMLRLGEHFLGVAIDRVETLPIG